MDGAPWPGSAKINEIHEIRVRRASPSCSKSAHRRTYQTAWRACRPLLPMQLRKYRLNGRHLKNGETNIRLSCYPPHALGDNRPQWGRWTQLILPVSGGTNASVRVSSNLFPARALSRKFFCGVSPESLLSEPSDQIPRDRVSRG
jgi:hypothetical protein